MRLFFALIPPPAVRQALARAAASVRPRGGRAVPAENLHLTLHFLGAVAPEVRACVEQAAGGVQAPPFTLTIERAGWFPRARVAWLAPAEVPEPACALVRELAVGLRDCGLTPDARPFAAHVTIARRVRRPPRCDTVDPVVWPVDAFCLMASRTDPAGARYEVLRRWPLGGGSVR